MKTSTQHRKPRKAGGRATAQKHSAIPDYRTLPPSDKAAILGLRGLGYSYREISSRVGRDKDTVGNFLNSPEAQARLAEDATNILQRYRDKALGLVPEALEGLKELIEQRDRAAISKLLFGSQVLVTRSEQRIESPSTSPEEQRPLEERIYFTLHKHWPDEECECKPASGAV